MCEKFERREVSMSRVRGRGWEGETGWERGDGCFLTVD